MVVLDHMLSVERMSGTPKCRIPKHCCIRFTAFCLWIDYFEDVLTYLGAFSLLEAMCIMSTGELTAVRGAHREGWRRCACRVRLREE